MRIRATVAAVSGALALSVLAVPVAQADDGPAALSSVTPFGNVTAADESIGDTKIKSVTVNGGKSIVVGTSVKKKFTISVTATDRSGIRDGYAFLWHGSSIPNADGAIVPKADKGTCKKVNTTTSTCSVTVIADPLDNIYDNDLAGTWKVMAGAQGRDGDYVIKEAYKTVKVKRFTKLTIDAAPEPVKKGQTITVTGKLSRADWDTLTYKGYSQQPVSLQFAKKGTSAYKTVKTFKSGSAGSLKTTVKASVDGTYRFTFAGTSIAGATSSAGDVIDVK